MQLIHEHKREGIDNAGYFLFGKEKYLLPRSFVKKSEKINGSFFSLATELDIPPHLKLEDYKIRKGEDIFHASIRMNGTKHYK